MTWSPKINWLSALLALGLFASSVLAAENKPAAAPAPKLDFGGKRTEFELAGKSAFLIEPSAPAKDGVKPWVWYAPVINRNPGPALTWLFGELLKNGFYIAGIAVGETYASPASRAEYQAFYRHVRHTYGLDARACLLAQSRGGLNLYHFAAENPSAVACIAGIYPVGDLRSYPTLKRAAPAYGLTETQLTEELSAHNPIELLAPLARLNIPILHIHGDADKIVPLEQNSGAIAERYKALGGRMQVIVIPGRGHEEIPAYFESPEILRFILTQGRSLSR